MLRLYSAKPFVFLETMIRMILGGTLQAYPELGGFNFHRALENSIAKTIGKFSAGCQVVQVPEDFNYIISLVKATSKIR